MNPKKSSAWEKVTSLPTRAAAVVDDYRTVVAKTNAKEYLTYEARQQHVKELREEAKQRLHTLRLGSQTSFNSLQDQIARTLGPSSSSNDTQALLSEVKRQRAWARFREVLNQTHAERQDPLFVVRDEAMRVAKAGDVETLRAFQEEVPSYFRARGLEEYSEPAQKFIEQALEQTYNEPQREAAAARDELSKGWQWAVSALSMAEYALDDPYNTPVAITSFDGGVVQIEGMSSFTVEQQPTYSLPKLDTVY